jgi:renalase
MSIVIVGAGLSGLLMGSSLRSQGIESVILEKSKAVGGRIATRRILDYSFDHGIQRWPDGQEVQELFKKFNITYNHFSDGLCLQGGATQLPKKMLVDLKIEKNQKVKSLNFSTFTKTWTLICEEGKKWSAEKIVLTAPAPQVVELVQNSQLSQYSQINTPLEKLKSIAYDKVVLGLFLADTAFDEKEFLASQLVEAKYLQKMNGLSSQALVLKLNSQIASEIFDKSDEEINQLLLTEFKKIVPTKNLLGYELKKWRYAIPQTHLQEDYLSIVPGLYVIGDFFHSSPILSVIHSASRLHQDWQRLQ